MHSGNAGGARSADFLSNVISQAPKLISVNASSNWIPIESLPAICSFLKAGKGEQFCIFLLNFVIQVFYNRMKVEYHNLKHRLGKLEHVNLRQNPLCNKPDIASLLDEFQENGKPNILCSSPVMSLYDNDP